MGWARMHSRPESPRKSRICHDIIGFLLHSFNFQLTIPWTSLYGWQNLFSGIGCHYAVVFVTNPKHWSHCIFPCLLCGLPSIHTPRNNLKSLKNTPHHQQQPKKLLKKPQNTPPPTKLKQTNQPPPPPRKQNQNTHPRITQEGRSKYTPFLKPTLLLQSCWRWRF